MTTTIPTPIALDAHCPAWCTEHTRVAPDEVRHQAPALLDYAQAAEIPGRRRRVFVTPEQYVRADGSIERNVYLQDETEGILGSATEVAQLVDALMRAAHQAFGDGAFADKGR